jgi:hypothetical protein
MTAPINTRPIPSTGEALPVIGCGTYIGFDLAPGTPGHAKLPGVLAALFAAGNREQAFIGAWLGAGAAEIRAEPPGRDLRDSRHRPVQAHAGQPGGRPGQRAPCGILAPACGFAGGVRADDALQAIESIAACAYAACVKS